MLPSCDSADREGGIFIGNIVNALGALHPRILVGGDSAATAAASPERQGNGAPSGPNCLLFSDADRPSDSLRDRSGVG